MKRLAAVTVVLLSCSAAHAENFMIFGRGQLYQGSYTASGGYMIGPRLQITQWGGTPLYTQQPQQYVQPGYYTMPVYQPYRPAWRWGW